MHPEDVYLVNYVTVQNLINNSVTSIQNHCRMITHQDRPMLS